MPITEDKITNKTQWQSSKLALLLESHPNRKVQFSVKGAMIEAQIKNCPTNKLGGAYVHCWIGIKVFTGEGILTLSPKYKVSLMQQWIRQK